MKQSTHLVLQALALIAQFANLDLSAYGHGAQAGVGLAVALAQAGLAWYAHNYNPDGTPATAAYEKKE